jgi:2-keto-3-deoxy-6-phosphogluconate aldolase
VQEVVMEILKVCKQFNVACATGVRSPGDVEKRLEQGFRLLTDMPQKSAAAVGEMRKVVGS